MTLTVTLDKEEIRRDWFVAAAKDPRNAGLIIRTLKDLVQDDQFPAKVGDDASGDHLKQYRKYIHQVSTCKLSTELLEYYVCNLDSRGDGIIAQTDGIVAQTPKPKKANKKKAKIEDIPQADQPTEVVATTEVEAPAFDPYAATNALRSEVGGVFSTAGKDSKYSSSSATLTTLKEHYLNGHPGDKDADMVWQSAAMRIKLAADHIMTHEKYGLSTITIEMKLRDDFGFTNFKTDVADDAYTRLTKVFNFFPSLEIMINGLESIITKACEGDTNFKYINVEELSQVDDLLKVAYARNGGDGAVRQSRRNVVSIAYYRSTIAHVEKESEKSFYTKDQLNIAKNLYSELINTDLIENLNMTAHEVKVKVDAAMTNLVPKWEVGKPKVKTNVKKKKNVPNNTGLAYAAGATPAKICDKCKEMGLGKSAYTSHTTENHKEEYAQKNKQKAERGKKKAEKPASEAEAKA